jgi:hypothetical protein
MAVKQLWEKLNLVNMKVKAPKGYHWMKNGKTYKLMKHTGKFIKHKGASLEANFPTQKVHKK